MDKFETFWQMAAALPAVKDGISPMDMAAMPPMLSSLLRAISRSAGMSLDNLAAESGFDLEQASRISALLVERGYLLAVPSEQAGVPAVYRVRLARTRRHNLPVNF